MNENNHAEQDALIDSQADAVEQPEHIQRPTDRAGMPHNEDAECAVLGAMLIDNAIIPDVCVTVSETAFYSKNNRRVYGVIKGMWELGDSAIDQLTVADTLMTAGKLDEIGGAAFIAGLARETATSANWKAYADILIDQQNRRKLHNLATQTLLNIDGQSVTADDMTQWIQEQAREIQERNPTIEKALPISEVTGDFPRAILGASKRNGAVLSEGAVCMLSGEGGIAKSALTCSLALAFASAETSDQLQTLKGDLFNGSGGNVLMATFEDAPAVTAWRLRELGREWDTCGKTFKNKLFLMGMQSPIFGPGARGNAAGLYNARPEPLGAWDTLWREAKEKEARLIIIDPALAAYVGNQNEAAAVREFLNALSREAGNIGAGVLLVAHSNKTARASNDDPFDAGLVSGSTAWHDGVRGVLTMTWGEDTGERRLAISKANYGETRKVCDLAKITAGSGAIVGFVAGENGWAQHKPQAKKNQPKKNPQGEYESPHEGGNGELSEEAQEAMEF